MVATAIKMADPKLENDVLYMIVNNIPSDYHSSDLRNFFSHFIETGGFKCFHFRHRPEVQKPSEKCEIDISLSRRVTLCCVIKVFSNRSSQLLKTYNGEHWLDRKGETLLTRCFLKKIILPVVQDNPVTTIDVESFKKGVISTNSHLNLETFSWSDLNALIEMHPPSCMPNGNVGTKTSHFLSEIKACRLPPSLITKLGLQFPRNRARRIYGNVPFDYQKKHGYIEAMKIIPEYSNKGTWSFKKKELERVIHEDRSSEESEEEEWDRHCAFHDDVTGQERIKERLFEEKIELKWEKGGSGLVFYTDSCFWDKQEGDFDAKTSDDWDIDLGVYHEPSVANDRDARDLMTMRLEKRLKDGTAIEGENLDSFAAFERYNKGFGRKVLEAHGWKQGQGVGRKAAGIAEPIIAESRHPTDKKGFGYRGEKLKSLPYKRPRRRKHWNQDPDAVYISTVYDDPLEMDPPEQLHTSSAFTKLKYRKEFLKQKSRDS